MATIACIVASVGVLVMCVALITGAITSRRAARWHQQRVSAAVDRVYDRLVAGLDDDRSH